MFLFVYTCKMSSNITNAANGFLSRIALKPVDGEKAYTAVKMDVKLPKKYPQKDKPGIKFSPLKGFEEALSSEELKLLAKNTAGKAFWL